MMTSQMPVKLASKVKAYRAVTVGKFGANNDDLTNVLNQRQIIHGLPTTINYQLLLFEYLETGLKSAIQSHMQITF